MKFQVCLRLLAVLIFASTYGAAQAQSAPSSQGLEAITVPLAEAEEHLIQQPIPVYPPPAKVARVEGTVDLTLEVDAEGIVQRVVKSSGNPLLLQAATETALQYRYRPFEMSGKPTKVFVESHVSFALYFLSTPHVPFPEVSPDDDVAIEYEDYQCQLRIHRNGVVEYDARKAIVVPGRHQSSEISIVEMAGLNQAKRWAHGLGRCGSPLLVRVKYKVLPLHDRVARESAV